MTPIEAMEWMAPKDWERFSTEHPPRGKRGRGTNTFEKDLVEAVIEGDGGARIVTYSSSYEAYHAGNRFRNAGKDLVRVIKVDPKTIAIGPVDNTSDSSEPSVPNG